MMFFFKRMDSMDLYSYIMFKFRSLSAGPERVEWRPVRPVVYHGFPIPPARCRCCLAVFRGVCHNEPSHTLLSSRN